MEDDAGLYHVKVEDEEEGRIHCSTACPEFQSLHNICRVRAFFNPSLGLGESGSVGLQHTLAVAMRRGKAEEHLGQAETVEVVLEDLLQPAHAEDAPPADAEDPELQPAYHVIHDQQAPPLQLTQPPPHPQCPMRCSRPWEEKRLSLPTTATTFPPNLWLIEFLLI